MNSAYRTLVAAVAFSSCAVAALAVTPASAMPAAKQGVTIESPLVQQVAYYKKKPFWKKKQHCSWVKKVHWYKGHKHVKYVKVCKKGW